LRAMATAQLTQSGVNIRNVLIATDFSRKSSEVIRVGMDLCRVYGAHAYILNVLARDEFLLAGFEAYVAAREATRRDLLDLECALRSQHLSQEGKDYELLMREGDVADGILDCARQRQADLIVIGTHGRSGLRKAFLGSVAERIFRHSNIPVLTVGPNAHLTNAFAPKRLLVPVDFTPASQLSAKWACALAHEHQAELVLLHVIGKADVEGVADKECLQRSVEQSLAEMVYCDAEPGRTRFMVQTGQVINQVIDAALQVHPDLMVLGVHEYPGLLNRLRWQTAYELVRQSPCPVLTVREHASGSAQK
jgi:nucleotide-binding universal stress UspA family protein